MVIFNKNKEQEKSKKGKVLTKQIKLKPAQIVIGITIIAFVLFSFIWALSSFVTQGGKKLKNENQIIDSELARAMTYEQFQDGDDAVYKTDENGQVTEEVIDNVKFSAFFLRDLDGDGYAEKLKGTCKEIGKKDTLYMEVKVLTEGKLTDGIISIDGENFTFSTALPQDDELKESYIGNNIVKIEFNDILNGSQKIISGNVQSKIGRNINDYSKDNKVTFTGKYVYDDNTEVEVKKEVVLHNDWYGKVNTAFETKWYSSFELQRMIDEDNGKLNLEFDIQVEETDNQLLLKKSYLEGIIPLLNGYEPISVTSNGNSTYDSETRKLIIENESSVSEDGNILKLISGNITYRVRVVYPLEAYETLGSDTITLEIPVIAYFEGYNNRNEEFENPYKSNVRKETLIATYMNPAGDVAIFNVSLGRYVSNLDNKRIVSKKKPLNLYNELSEEESDDIYVVRWKANLGTNGSVSGITFEEANTDMFVKDDSTEESMEDLISNIGIGFRNASEILGDDGWIKIYDKDSNNILVEFGKNDWEKYTEDDPFYYDLPVKHIRVETSATKNNSILLIYNIKEIDDEKVLEKYDKEFFDSLKFIKSSLTGYIEGEYVNTDTNIAEYYAPPSIFDITIDKGTISTQITEKNVGIKIKAQGDESREQLKWKNGIFLLKFPQEIIDLNINDITTNNNQLQIVNYEKFIEDDCICIKIYTNNEKYMAYDILLDCDITANPKTMTSTQIIELYAINENAYDYETKGKDKYDIDANNNQEEYVGYKNTYLSLVSPNSLLTNESIINYDSENSITIAPKIAVVDKERERATVAIELLNNYTSTISDVVLLGRIPFSGNKYTVSMQDMGSDFSTELSSEGICLPEDLKNYATIYYSEKEDATRDLNNQSNGWTTEPTDFSTIKSFLIDFNDFVLEKNYNASIYYDLIIPQGLNYNSVAYSNHAVFFSLDTVEGKYKTYTEPNKVGITIGKEYSLELIKYQENTNKIIPNAFYELIEEDGTTSITKKTDNSGKISIDNLLIEKNYIIREKESPEGYELNENEIEFTTYEENGLLRVEIDENDIKELEIDDDNGKILIETEDREKAKLKLIKTNKSDDTVIKGVKFVLQGNGISESGKIITTNQNGEAYFSKICIGETYLLTETKADGYYLSNPIEFKVIKDGNGNYSAEISDNDSAKEYNIVLDNQLPTLNLSLENVSIPKYKLKIIKSEKDNPDVRLPGTKFRLYENGKEKGTYITDINGEIIIEHLYQSQRNDYTYTLKEIEVPEGYSKAKDKVFKIENKDDEITLVEELNENEEMDRYEVYGDTVNLYIENNPNFKVIKYDSETGEFLPNTKFAIYNIDDENVPAKNSKGEIIGEKEIINGIEYYTVKTNEEGKITVDLPEGLYKIKEIDAEEKYDIDNKVYYFGVSNSTETNASYITEWNKEDFTSVFSGMKTNDGGAIAAGHYETSYSSIRGKIIKYDAYGNIQWQCALTSSYTNVVKSIIQTSDGGYLASGIFSGSIYGNTLNINGKTIRNSTTHDEGFIVKFDPYGNVQWGYDIGIRVNSITEDSLGNYLVAGYGSVETINGYYVESYNDTKRTFIASIDIDGNVNWAKALGNGEIKSIVETENGDYVAVGYIYQGHIDFGNGVELNSEGISFIILRYSYDGNVLLAKVIPFEGNYYRNLNLYSTNDGGYIFDLYLNQNSKLYLEDDKIISIPENSSSPKTVLLKFNSNNELEWYEQGDGQDRLLGTNEESIIVGRDREAKRLYMYDYNGEKIGYIDIDFVPKNISFYNADSYYAFGSSRQDDDYNSTTSSYYSGNFRYYNGYVAKISKTEMEHLENKYIESLGGGNDDLISDISLCTDNGIFVGLNYSSSEIPLLNEQYIYNEGQTDGVILKKDKKNNLQWYVKIYGDGIENVNAIIGTKDGGALACCSSSSQNIFVGDTIIDCGNDSVRGILVKLDKQGNVVWTKVIPENELKCIAQTANGGYLIGGNGIILKIDNQGEILWKNKYANSFQITSIIETNNEKIVVSGKNANVQPISLGNNIETSNTYGPSEGFVVQYDKEGQIEWLREFGKELWSGEISSAIQTSDNGFLIGGTLGCGTTVLEDGTEIYIRSGSYGPYGNCGLIIKYDANWNIEWIKELKNDKDYNPPSQTIKQIFENSDGKIIVIGTTGLILELENNVILNNSSSNNVGMIIQFDSKGNAEWGKSYPIDTMEKIIQDKSDNYYVKGYFENSIFLEDGKSVYNKGGIDGFILKSKVTRNILDYTELLIDNNRKEYKITTKVELVDGVKGGLILGENEKPYEIVKHGDSSVKPISMMPDEGYEVVQLTVNGEEQDYTILENGTVIMPQFDNVTENKHVVVKFIKTSNKIVINKTDKNTGDRISGAEFAIDQVEERPELGEVIGVLHDNSKDFYEPDYTNELEDVFGELTSNGTYYFVNDNGVLVPNNSKTWRENNIEGATGGMYGYATSYIPIDLTDKEGNYVVVANIEANYNYSYGSAKITETTSAPDGTSSNDSFMYSYVFKEAQDYISMNLEGGKVYYLHLGYYSYNSPNYEDELKINSIKIYGAIKHNYNFIEIDGRYESTNQGKNSTVSNSYIPIDLTNVEGNVDLIVNAEISSEGYSEYNYSADIGYLYISNTTDVPSNYYGFVQIYGEVENREYRCILSGGSIYYLHLGYWKNDNNSRGEDKFTVNSLRVVLNSDHLYHTTARTNNNGQAFAQVPYGLYKITEKNAPLGYYKNSEIKLVQISENEENQYEVNIENEKLGKVIVHHYIKGTETKIVDDEILEGKIGETYLSNPLIDLRGYELEKDEMSKYIIPFNFKGNYLEETQEVIYYYEPKATQLVVHHYIENTESPVPLGDGTNAEDVTKEGKVGEEYITEVLDNSVLNEEYELVRIPDNAIGTYGEERIEVTYYYKKIVRTVVVEKTAEDTGLPLSGVVFEIDGEEYTTNERGKIVLQLEYGTHEIVEKEAKEGYQKVENIADIEITRETENNEVINITNEKNKGTVTVNHYVEGTTQPIELLDGSLAPTENKRGEIGSIYATKPHDDINKYSVLSDNVPNGSGEYIDGNIDVIYYYSLKPAEVTVNHFIMNPDGTKTEIPVPLRETGIVAQSEHIDGKVDDDYTTTSKTEYELNSNYELVETPTNAEGKMTVEPQIVNYYYGLKSTKVIVHHYQEPSETNGEIVKLKEDEEILGRITEEYTTHQASSDELPRKFEYSRKTDNYEGTMTQDTIEVIYYYKTRDAVLNIKYEDYYTHEEISPEEHQTGKVDDDYITSEKEITGWTYVESTNNETGKLDVDPITVIFYYKKQTKVTVNYIDKSTGELLEQPTTITGLSGDAYETIAKDFTKYVLTDPMPTNANGNMTNDEIVVNYYYIKPATSLIEKHIDVTNNEILATETHTGTIGEGYNIPPRTFEGYDLVEERLPTNAQGQYTENVQEVIYYYIKKASLIVKYVDKYTGEEIPNDDGTPSGRNETNHHEGDSYTTERKVFEDYVLIEVPTNADGELLGGTTEVIYEYKHISGGVIENHIDKATGMQLIEETKHEGYVGEDYETHEKEFANYDLVQEEYPANATGKFKVEEQRVTYYYIKKASVTVKYVDEETNRDIPNADGSPSKEEKTGHVGDRYTSTAKEFEGYILSREPENKTGRMTEDPQTVVYYYKKVKFNLKIEKTIKSITVNGVEQEINGDLAKAEVYRKDLGSQEIQVRYKIRVTNDSEVEGKATIMERVPDGMIMKSTDNSGWSISGTSAMLETEEIIPGETKEYEVVLHWDRKGDNFGTKENKASIIGTENKHGLKDSNPEDNEDSADLIIAVSTGEINYAIGATMLLILLCGIIITYKRLDNKRNRVW